MKLIVGNWKMNQTLTQVGNFFETLKVAGATKHEAWIAPQTLHIDLALRHAPDEVQIGAQNVSSEDSGAFTGENSPFALKEMGATFVIIGHSERRQIFGEASDQLVKKVRKSLTHGLHVIYCVGETLQERESDQTFNVIEEQLRVGLKDLGEYNPSQLIVAYEPVWAIGTGKVATPSQAQEVHAAIRKQVGPGTRILYGGSVKPDNVSELLKQKDIDGALVGGASLKPTDFLALCQAPV